MKVFFLVLSCLVLSWLLFLACYLQSAKQHDWTQKNTRHAYNIHVWNHCIFIFPQTCLKFNMLLPFKLLHCHGWELWDELPVHYLALSDKTGRNLPRLVRGHLHTFTIWYLSQTNISLQVEFVLSQRFKITSQKRSLLILLFWAIFSIWPSQSFNKHKESSYLLVCPFQKRLSAPSSGANAAGSGLVRG